MIIIALLAVILPMFFLAILNMPAIKGMTYSAIIVLFGAFIFWQMPIKVLSASILQGIHKTLPILWILFGALLMLAVLRTTGAIERINRGFVAVTGDLRVLTVIIVFLFGGLIEGVSGFGTPAMVTAPLLMALGFRPIAAVTLALVGDSTSASFGAVGTPLTVGLSNVANGPDFMQHVGRTITQLDLTAGAIVPTLIVFLLVRFFGREKKNHQAWVEMLPWTLLIGIVYALVAWLTVHWIGYEFASILTPLIMLIVAIVTVRFKLLLPASVYVTPWSDALENPGSSDLKQETKQAETMSLFKAWVPYLLVVVLLLLTRVIQPLQHQLLHLADLSWHNILGFKTISSDWQLLYSPGTILVVAAIIGLAIQMRSLKPLRKQARTVVGSMVSTGLTLVVTLIMVQIFSNSGINTQGLVSMPIYIANSLAQFTAPIWVFIAPFLGELGAFITGSATVSTLTFAPIQFHVAQQSHLEPQMILAMQVIGAAAGNMVCVHNIVAASAVVGLGGQEGAILRKTAIPAVIYAILLGITGFVWSIF
ncbi:L-lactate permease [Weissella diestrammenae]|uniref:L-lactate permease n=1 Tax=Weissella diestrammenae TaxID=1162633 RepID=A0A7G9T3J9_9LACO|nr:L-lactate permease [Weissella diestrammenae]MCM0582645.1 L-lactate permease [Weissella diestrammenae]QNN74674.1 L-lactate permease [Weissella diestrammenae]